MCRIWVKSAEVSRSQEWREIKHFLCSFVTRHCFSHLFASSLAKLFAKQSLATHVLIVFSQFSLKQAVNICCHAAKYVVSNFTAPAAAGPCSSMVKLQYPCQHSSLNEKETGTHGYWVVSSWSKPWLFQPVGHHAIPDYPCSEHTSIRRSVANCHASKGAAAPHTAWWLGTSSTEEQDRHRKGHAGRQTPRWYLKVVLCSTRWLVLEFLSEHAWFDSKAGI